MSDIAREAGISTPTLYASFKHKDEMLVGVIRYYTERRLYSFQERCSDVEDLGEKLEIYFEEMILAGYDLLQNLPDGQDARNGLGELGRTAFGEVRLWSCDALIEILVPYQTKIASTGQTIDQLARFIVNTSAGLR